MIIIEIIQRCIVVLNETVTKAIVSYAPYANTATTVDAINVCCCDISPHSFERDIDVFIAYTLCVHTISMRSFPLRV